MRPRRNNVSGRNILQVLLTYHNDPLVEDISSLIVHIQLAKLKGYAIPHYEYASDSKEITTLSAAGDYDDRCQMLTSILYKHMETYYPELLEDK